jgi:hypothetical protein
MLTKVVIVTILLGILLSLGTALFHMVKGQGSSERTARALTVRIGVSIALFALLLVLGATGVINPHGITH